MLAAQIAGSCGTTPLSILEGDSSTVTLVINSLNLFTNLNFANIVCNTRFHLPSSQKLESFDFFFLYCQLYNTLFSQVGCFLYCVWKHFQLVSHSFLRVGKTPAKPFSSLLNREYIYIFRICDSHIHFKYALRINVSLIN